MRVRNYDEFVRDFANWANAVNRTLPYDYAGAGGSAGQPLSDQTVSLPIDVVSAPEGYTVHAYVPGINPEDVEITFEGDELTIRGKLPAAAEGAELVKRELFHGSFERRLTFNVPVNVDGIEAHFHNGLLTLHVPKAEAVRPKLIKVQTKVS